MFWRAVDRIWLSLASVKLTVVILVAFTLLSIPGTIVNQHTISSVDPGTIYKYDFWKWGQRLQLFTSYYSFWYVGLFVILSLNLIVCSIERWPQMWKMATQKPVLWAKETFANQPQTLRHSWTSRMNPEKALEFYTSRLKKHWYKPVLLKKDEKSFQLFWQQGRWSRVANYLVHTSLLLVFVGAIYSSIKGFEGGVSLPEGRPVDTFLLFKEGPGSGLKRVPGGLDHERLLGFRVEVERFEVKFYKDFPGRPQSFESKIKIYEKGELKKEGYSRVNEPFRYKNMIFYQSSYGRTGEYQVRLKFLDNKNPQAAPQFVKAQLGEAITTPSGTTLMAMRGSENVQDLGPGIFFQEFRGMEPVGKGFWVLQDYPDFDLKTRKSDYGVVLEGIREVYFSGFQIGSDPGAPLYWFGCFGMLLGTFYALLVTHRKYYLNFENGEVQMAGVIHRLPFGFEKQVASLVQELKKGDSS